MHCFVIRCAGFSCQIRVFNTLLSCIVIFCDLQSTLMCTAKSSQMSATAVQPRSVHNELCTSILKLYGTEKIIDAQSITRNLGTQNIWQPT